MHEDAKDIAKAKKVGKKLREAIEMLKEGNENGQMQNISRY